MTGIELFVYWRVARTAKGQAIAAVQTFQQALALGAPGLQARLLQRADEAGEQVTLMEAYALPGQRSGIPPLLQREIVEVGDSISGPWRLGPRHVEVFVGADPGS